MNDESPRAAETRERFVPSRLAEPVAGSLRRILDDAGFEKARRLPGASGGSVPGELARAREYVTGGANCWRSSRMMSLYRHLFARAHGRDLVALFDLFFRHQELPLAALPPALDDETLAALVDATVLRETPRGVQATIRCFPSRGMYFMCDPRRSGKDYVYCGNDSYAMVEVTEGHMGRRRFGRALDLCTGSGIQGLSMCRRSEEVVCVDLNPRALEFVAANARLNGIRNVEARQSDLYSAVTGRFDCITANTPYVPEPEGGQLPIRGGNLGIEFTLRLIAEIPDRLSEDGVVVLYTSDPIVNGRRVLMDHVRETIEDHPMKATIVAIKRMNFPLTPAHREHFRRLGMSGYDDTILILEPARRWEVVRAPWRPAYYLGTRIDGWLDWKLRSAAR